VRPLAKRKTKKDMIPSTQLKRHNYNSDEPNDVSSKLDKVIKINIQLQEKIASLSEGVTVLAKSVKEFTNMFEKARPLDSPITEDEELENKEESVGPDLPAVSEMPDFEIDDELEDEEDIEPEPKQPLKRKTADFSKDLKALLKENRELISTLKDVKNHLKKRDTRNEIRKAIERSG